MDDSNFIQRQNRELYLSLNRRTIRSRISTLAGTVRTVASEPYRFATIAARLVIKNPRKFAQILLGKRTIQNTSSQQHALDEEYMRWINSVERVQFKPDEQLKKIKSFKKRPLISLITPVFDPPLEAHNKLIESVINQTYDNFEVLLFNFGDDPAIRELLDDWAANDPRIKVKHDLKNEGISKNSNFCLKYVKGEFVGLLDHDDALLPSALFACVEAMNKQTVDFVYTDKDKITEDDSRHDPLFKPDWSPEMALGGNYMTHFNLMRTSIVRKLGGWDPATDGAQDWDLFLRILDSTDRVVHVPQITYHWRTVAGSTATEVSVKPYALAAQRLAVQKHLDRHNLGAKAVQDETCQTFVEWGIVPQPTTFILHIAYGDVGHIKTLAHDIISQSWFRSDFEVLVIAPVKDISNRDKQTLLKLDKVRVEEYEVGNFVQALSSTLATSKSTHALYIADSTKEITCELKGSNYAGQLLGWLTKPGVSVAGGSSYSDNGRIIDIGSFFNPAAQVFEKYYFSTGFRSGYTGHPQWLRNFVLVSERLFAFEVSLLDDMDTALQAVRDDEFTKLLALLCHAEGNRSVYDPSVQTIDSAPFYSAAPFSTPLEAFLKHSCKDLLIRDPYYNQNLNRNYIDPRPATNAVETTKVTSGPAVRSFD